MIIYVLRIIVIIIIKMYCINATTKQIYVTQITKPTVYILKWQLMWYL